MVRKTLAAWMVDKSYSDETLAAKVGTDRTTISRLRRGKQRPSWALIAKLEELSGGEVTALSFDVAAEEDDPAETVTQACASRPSSRRARS